MARRLSEIKAQVRKESDPKILEDRAILFSPIKGLRRKESVVSTVNEVTNKILDDLIVESLDGIPVEGKEREKPKT